MNDTPIPFQFNEFQIPTVGTPEDPWFVAADVCKACNIKHHAQATETLDADERGVFIVITPSGPQQMLCVNESGLYAITIKSRKPAVKAFRKWTTSEVLPALRKTGSFTVGPAQPAYAIPPTYAEALILTGKIQLALEQQVELTAKEVTIKMQGLLVAIEDNSTNPSRSRVWLQQPRSIARSWQQPRERTVFGDSRPASQI